MLLRCPFFRPFLHGSTKGWPIGTVSQLLRSCSRLKTTPIVAETQCAIGAVHDACEKGARAMKTPHAMHKDRRSERCSSIPMRCVGAQLLHELPPVICIARRAGGRVGTSRYIPAKLNAAPLLPLERASGRGGKGRCHDRARNNISSRRGSSRLPFDILTCLAPGTHGTMHGPHADAEKQCRVLCRAN